MCHCDQKEGKASHEALLQPMWRLAEASPSEAQRCMTPVPWCHEPEELPEQLAAQDLQPQLLPQLEDVQQQQLLFMTVRARSAPRAQAWCHDSGMVPCTPECLQEECLVTGAAVAQVARG